VAAAPSDSRRGGWVAGVGAYPPLPTKPGVTLRTGPGWHAAVSPPARLGESEGELVAQFDGEPDQQATLRFDPATGTQSVACDRFGLRGVSYVRGDGFAVSASDPRLLSRSAGVTPRLDAAAIHGYLCLSHVPSPLTMWSGVRSLRAGEQAVLRPASLDVHNAPAWRECEPAALDQLAAVQELERRLEAAVRSRVGSASEVALFLSGGLDSSLIAALLVRLGVRVHLFTLDFGAPHHVELPFARRVAEHLGRPLHVVPAGAREVQSALVPTVAALQQPFGDAVTVPLYLLGKAASGYASMVFNGEGGDQLFGGWTNKPMIAAELYGAGAVSRTETYLTTYHRFYGITDPLYTQRARELTDGVLPAAWVEPALNADGFTSLMHRLRAANLALKGAQNIAPRAVQLADACGLAVRSPFFDTDLTEWSFSLPTEWLLHGACEKHLLKQVAEKYLPSEIVWREKRGMGVPVTEWLLGPLRNEVARYLSPARIRRDGWFAPDAIIALRRGDDRPSELRRRRLGEKLWALLILQAWCDAQEPRPVWPTE